MPTSPSPRARPRSRFRSGPGAERGFTLIELMVAMTAGLAVSFAAFMLSKNATAFFQQESRIGAAHFSAMMGVNRIGADIQRAGFLSSPNVQVDPFRCGEVATWPQGLQRLAAVSIRQGGSGVLPQSALNGFTPDDIVIGGSFSTTEQFPVRAIVTGAGGGVDVHLQTDSGPMARTLTSSTVGGETLEQIFRAGRFLRLVDPLGRHEYGVIEGVEVLGDPVNRVVVSLRANPAVPMKLPSTTCGYSGLGVGMLANPVSRVLYDLRSVAANPRYARLVASQAEQMTRDEGRTELVRVELDADGVEMGDTLEVVSEFAVDLKFGLTTASAGQNPQTVRHRMNSAEVYQFAGEVTNVGAAPQRIRSVQVRLSARARAPDRQADLGTGPDGRKMRFLIDPSMPSPQFARMRTFYSEVSLPNLAGVTW